MRRRLATSSRAVERMTAVSAPGGDWLVKTLVGMVARAPHAVFQLAEAESQRNPFARILTLINGLRGPRPMVATLRPQPRRDPPSISLRTEAAGLKTSGSRLFRARSSDHAR